MIELYCQSHCRRCTRSEHCKSWRVLPLRVSHAEWSRKPFIRTVVSRSLLINFSLKIFVLTIRPEWNTYVLDNVWTSMRFVYMTAAAVLREAGERPLQSNHDLTSAHCSTTVGQRDSNIKLITDIGIAFWCKTHDRLTAASQPRYSWNWNSNFKIEFLVKSL